MLIGHQKQWNFLKRKYETGQLSHAYLFVGANGIGKKLFEKDFAGFIGYKFPDLMVVAASPEGEASLAPKGRETEIPIAKIREVQNFLAYKSYNGGFKIVIIDNAHLMNHEAQSCFLKTLEEPKGETVLFLISSKPDMLLPTIFSRCQTVKFFKPKNLPENSEKSVKEQELLKGLLAVVGTNFADKFKYVKLIDFEKQDAGEIVEVLQKYLRHLLMVKIGAEQSDPKDVGFLKYSFTEIKKAINVSEDISSKLLFTNANQKLALEILLMEI